jgi:hypothetical protein
MSLTAILNPSSLHNGAQQQPNTFDTYLHLAPNQPSSTSGDNNARQQTTTGANDKYEYSTYPRGASKYITFLPSVVRAPHFGLNGASAQRQREGFRVQENIAVLTSS